jgi:enoyl-CoA hydratase/carnithine racemase
MSDEAAPVVLALGGCVVGELVLNRPERKNALTPEVAEQLLYWLQVLEADEEVKVILLRGVGGFFCAGLDLKEMAEHRKEGQGDGGFGRHWRAFHSAMYHCAKPTCCCLEGGAIAGGSGLALAADFLVTDKSAFFHVAEVNFGMAAPMNIVWLTLKFGAAAAMFLAVGGQRLDGLELEKRGIAVKVAETGHALSACRAFAEELAKNDSSAMALNKRMIWHIQSHSSGGGGQGSHFEELLDRVMALAAAGKAPPRLESRLKSKATRGRL